MRHKLSYRALVKFGFSGYRALEIVIDAGRGEKPALAMCKCVLKIMRMQGELF